MNFRGFITIWHSTIESIPKGWLYCNGENGTPDLRNRFLVCSSPTIPYLSTGGSGLHFHEWYASSHNHQMQSGSSLGAGTGYDWVSEGESAWCYSDGKDVLPPYRSVLYIMKE